MSCAPQCCTGPHLLITICHLSCAPAPSTLHPPPNHTIPPLPVPYCTSQFLIPCHLFIPPGLTSLWILHRTLASQFTVFLCVVLFSAPVPFPAVFTCISIFSSCTPPRPPCTHVLLSFHCMVKHTEWVCFFPEIHILILPALQG